MSDDFKVLPMMQPKRVLTRTYNNTEYKIRLTRPITEIDDFEEEIMALEEAGPNDLVIMQLSSPGGSLETCDFLCRRMQECEAPIVIEIGLTCASAASAMCLHADEWVIHDSSTLMIHACSYSPGWGKEVDVFSAATYTNRINKEWLERTYKGFLSETELQSVLDGKDLYFYADDLRDRLPKYAEYRDSLKSEGCGDPSCGGCEQELLVEEQSFSLEDMIKQAVAEGIKQHEAEKAKKEAKAKKAAERKPTRKLEKALEQAKEIRENFEKPVDVPAGTA